MENDDDFFEGLFDDEDREIARKNALVSFYHDLTQAKEGVFINVSIGESGGVKYLIEHQYGSICRSHDLDEIRQDALNLIQIIDALTGSPGFNRGEYDKKVSESAQLYQEQQRAQYVPKPPKPPKPTSIYIMHNPTTGYYKIGRSANPSTRERTLQSQEPTIDLIATYPGTYQDERDLHDRYSAKRIRGEWFALNESDLASIAQHFTSKS